MNLPILLKWLLITCLSIVLISADANAQNKKKVRKHKTSKQQSGTITPEAGTKTPMATKELPATITNYVRTHYRSAKIKGATMVEKENNDVSYRIKLDGRTIIFDGSGRFVKAVYD